MNIKKALMQINALVDTRLVKLSSVIETESLGSPLPKFLNAVAKIQTSLKPRALLKELQKIEVGLGRPKKHAFWSRRTIDLDILFYANHSIERRDLSVPHWGISAREFVIKPLLEIL